MSMLTVSFISVYLFSGFSHIYIYIYIRVVIWNLMTTTIFLWKPFRRHEVYIGLIFYLFTLTSFDFSSFSVIIRVSQSSRRFASENIVLFGLTCLMTLACRKRRRIASKRIVQKRRKDLYNKEEEEVIRNEKEVKLKMTRGRMVKKEKSRWK